MVTLNIQLSDDVQERLQKRASEGGFTTVEQFAQAVLNASADGEIPQEELEQLLLERDANKSSSIEFTPEFADAFRSEVQARRSRDGRKA